LKICKKWIYHLKKKLKHLIIIIFYIWILSILGFSPISFDNSPLISIAFNIYNSSNEIIEVSSAGLVIKGLLTIFFIYNAFICIIKEFKELNLISGIDSSGK
jgi:hypothetical protein